VDLGHAALGALAIVLAAAALIRRRRAHSFHVRIDWDADESYRKDEHDR
jgi:hypothetical protein